MNSNRSTPRHIQDKERILKAAREKQLVTYKRASIQLSADTQQKRSKPEKNGKKYSK